MAMPVHKLFLFMLLFWIPMETRLEQRALFKACVRARETVQTTLVRVRAAWADHALSGTQIRHWFKVFKQDRDHTTKDAKRSGQPRSGRNDHNAAELQTQLHVDRRQTIRQLAHKTQLSTATTHRIMKKDLELWKICPKYIPKVLTQEQKDNRLRIARSNVTKIEQDPGLLARIIVTDESWMFTFDPRTKQSDMEWVARDVPRPRKALRGHTQKKTMLILFFDSHGVVSTFFLDQGTVNSDVYVQAVRQMREDLRRKRKALWTGCDFVLLQDNTTPHTCDDTMEYFQSVNMQIWEHPAYSPDLSPCDFWAFPVLKSKIRGHRFQNLEDLKVTVKRELLQLPLADFQNCFDNLLVRYRRCIEARGEYFEGRGSRGLPRQ